MPFELVLHCLTLQTSSELRVLYTHHVGPTPRHAIWLQMIKDPIFDFEISPEESSATSERNSH